MAETEIGVVKHFFDKIGVVVIDLTLGGLSMGDTIHIKGHTSDFTESINTLRIERDAIEKGEKGQSVGTKIAGKARIHDKVFRVTPD